MRNYEVTFVVDPVLSGDELKATADKYINILVAEGCTIVHNNEMGLRPLAYPINKRASGVYYCVEYTAPNGEVNAKLELQMRRDEQLLRFLTVTLDKFGVKYNEDKRAGKIAAAKKVGKSTKKVETRETRPARNENRPAPAVAAPVAAVETEAIVETVIAAPSDPEMDKMDAPVETAE